MSDIQKTRVIDHKNSDNSNTSKETSVAPS